METGDYIPRRVLLSQRAREMKEVADPVPVESYCGDYAPTFEDRVRNFIRAELSQVATGRGLESFDEADDLDFEDDEMPLSAAEVRELREEFAEATRSQSAPEEGAGSEPAPVSEPSSPAEPPQAESGGA